jgi:FtsP/CotA-like multicopper oxidase with cupredoxin domain
MEDQDDAAARRDISMGVLAFALGFGIFAMVFAVAALIQSNSADAATVVAGGDSDTPGELVVTEIDVALSEFSIDGNLSAPAGQVILNVVNEGRVPHNVALGNGPSTPDLNQGETFQLDLGELDVGTYQLICHIPGHADSGMTAQLSITPAGGAAVDDDHDHATDHEEDWEALDRAMVESIMAFPATTEGVGNVPLEPTILADGTKQFEITAQIVDWEVAPGDVVQAWTYNGMVPGPAIRVDLGDKVEVIVHNELPMSTDVHWHGISTPWEMDGVAPITQDLIGPGETFVYSFEAEEPAIGMYHAHHHAQMQVVNGMFATFIIGDTPIPYGEEISGTLIPEDLEIVDELPMVLNDAGVIGYSLNGKSFPATAPLVVEEGDWFVVHYYNEGLQIHPMHLHQFEQIVFAKDGVPLDYPYIADTINVAPGERYSVLVNADRAGTWVWHCHILTHVEREEGMFGMVTAIVVTPPE